MAVQDGGLGLVQASVRVRGRRDLGGPVRRVDNRDFATADHAAALGEPPGEKAGGQHGDDGDGVPGPQAEGAALRGRVVHVVVAGIIFQFVSPRIGVLIPWPAVRGVRHGGTRLRSGTRGEMARREIGGGELISSSLRATREIFPGIGSRPVSGAGIGPRSLKILVNGPAQLGGESVFLGRLS